MSQSSQSTLSKGGIPLLSIVALAVIFVAGLFVAGFDNGQIVRLAFAESGIDPMVIHELTHDIRHAAGFPCH